MLTAKVGESIINSFDEKYDRYTLKQWSNKNILKCPVCDGIYEYCHGEVVSPYFRHKEKDCEGYFSEPESDEHKQGKIILYNWLKEQEGVSNCQLEHWIPETKQRPDIYFEYKNQKFVVEFQCTPIASEFLKRRELYKLNNITDIWILGKEKYKIKMNKNHDVIYPENFRTIERELKKEGLMYFDVKRKLLLCNSTILNINNDLFEAIRTRENLANKIREFDLFSKLYKKKDIIFCEYLHNFTFDKGKIRLNDEVDMKFREVENAYINQSKETKRKADEIQRNFSEKYKSSIYVGDLNEKISACLMLLEKRTFFTRYGFTKDYTFVDKIGNIFSWMTSTLQNIKIGDYVELTGKVKSHEEYGGVKYTIITRCKIS